MTSITVSNNEANSLAYSLYPWVFDEYSEPRTIPPLWVFAENESLLANTQDAVMKTGQQSDQVSTSTETAAKL